MLLYRRNPFFVPLSSSVLRVLCLSSNAIDGPTFSGQKVQSVQFLIVFLMRPQNRVIIQHVNDINSRGLSDFSSIQSPSRHISGAPVLFIHFL